MKTSMSLLLLLLLFLLSVANISKGSRLLLEEGPNPQLASSSSSSLHYQIQEEMKESGVKVVDCGSDEGHCRRSSSASSSSSGKSTTRKLMTNEMTTSNSKRETKKSNKTSVGSAENTHKHPKADKADINKENDSFHHQATLPPPPPQLQRQTYPDILDIAGMDYSPAKRKPPIHN